MLLGIPFNIPFEFLLYIFTYMFKLYLINKSGYTDTYTGIPFYNNTK